MTFGLDDDSCLHTSQYISQSLCHSVNVLESLLWPLSEVRSSISYLVISSAHGQWVSRQNSRNIQGITASLQARSVCEVPHRIQLRMHFVILTFYQSFCQFVCVECCQYTTSLFLTKCTLNAIFLIKRLQRLSVLFVNICIVLSSVCRIIHLGIVDYVLILPFDLNEALVRIWLHLLHRLQFAL